MTSIASSGTPKKRPSPDSSVENSKKVKKYEGPKEFADLNWTVWRQRIRPWYTQWYPAVKGYKNLKLEHCKEFSLARRLSPFRLKRDGNDPEALATKCVLATYKNTIWYDQDGVKLVQYFPSLLTRRSPAILAELLTLIQAYPPKCPGTSEARHSQHEEWRKQFPSDTPVGVLRLTIHHQCGHKYDDPSTSEDLLAGPGKYVAQSLNFLRSEAIMEMSEFLSIVFAGVDPPKWRAYRDVYNEVASHPNFSILNIWNPNKLQAFVGHYILINMLTTLHCDTNDLEDGWAVMIVLGVFKGGELVLPDLGISLPYRPGDVVFLRSKALYHFIKKFKGIERYVIVLSTPASVFKWAEARMKNMNREAN